MAALYFYKYERHNFQNAGYPFRCIASKTLDCPEMTEFPEFSDQLTHGQIPGPTISVTALPSNINQVATPNFSYMVGAGLTLQPETYLYSSHRLTTKRKKKDFVKRQAKGEVILSPMRAFEIEVTRNPGVTNKLPNGSAHNVHMPEVAWGTSSGWLGNRCGHPMYQRTTVPLPLDDGYSYHTSTPSATLRLFKNHTRYWFSNATPSLVPRSITDAFAAGLEEHFNMRDMSTSLITEAQATANRGAMDLLTELAEARETIGFVFGSLRSLINTIVEFKKAVRSARRRPGASAAAIADEIAGLWMAFRYAIMPITYTISDALDYLDSEFKPYQTFRSGESELLDYQFDGWTVKGSPRVIDRVFLKHRYALDTKLHNLGFNPAATAWELTPLSFVVDWVLNIGDLLASLQTPSNVSDIGAQYSRQIRPTTLHVSRELQSFNVSFRYYEAKPININAHLGLSVDPSMTWKRWLDAVSLSWLTMRSLLKQG